MEVNYFLFRIEKQHFSFSVGLDKLSWFFDLRMLLKSH